MLLLGGVQHVAATAYTWGGSTGNWNEAGRWTPAGGPPASAADTGTVSAGEARINAALGAAGTRPTIMVGTNGTVRLDIDLTDASAGHVFILRGGVLQKRDTGRFVDLSIDDTLRVEQSGHVRGAGDSAWLRLNGRIEDGATPGRLFLRSDSNVGDRGVWIRRGTNTYSGGTEILRPAPDRQGRIAATATGSLGTGDVIVRSGAALQIGAARVNASGVIVVEGGASVGYADGVGGTHSLIASSGHAFQMRDGSRLELWQYGRWGSGNSHDALFLEGTVSFRCASDSGVLRLHGPTADGGAPGKMLLLTQHIPTDGGYELHGGKTHTGGLEAQTGTRVWLRATTGAGTGPITVNTTGTDDTGFWLDLVPDADWSLANDLLGKGMITVEDGSVHRLTAAGGTVDPGVAAGVIATNMIGRLRVDGRFAFAAGSRTPALKIDIAGVGGVAGTDFDQLLIDHGDATLAASLSACDLQVNVGPDIDELAGPITILSAPGANFTGRAFRSVTWSAPWSGTVVYGNGYVALKNLRGAPAVVLIR